MILSLWIQWMLQGGTLPAFQAANRCLFQWSAHVSGDDFLQMVDSAYEEIIKWPRNLFNLPTGKASTAFISETARLIQEFASASALERVALKAVMVLHVLVLQKPADTSSAKTHLALVERRLALWKAGDVDALMHEARSIQSHRQRVARDRQTHSGGKDHAATVFARLVMQGKIKAAIRYVSEQAAGGVLSINDLLPGSSGMTVGDVLREKHPEGRDADPAALLQGPVLPVQPVLLESLDALTVKRCALRLTGAAGPSGVDASGWTRMCCSFGLASVDLCRAVANLGRRLTCHFVDPACLEALTACRLIPLDKCPGVRPIGIGEVLRRLVTKAVLSILSPEVRDVCGSLELCAGQPAGAEAAVHALSDLFQSGDVEGVLLVDASNAFNTLNRRVMMHNIQLLCPMLAVLVINLYRSAARLFVLGGGEVRSEEGTTQGDPLGMPIYALGLLPLIQTLWSIVRQAWFADDAAGAGLLSKLKAWWQQLVELGAFYGYFPNASKSWLIVRPELLDNARSLFADLGIQITTEGRRYLGGAIGSPEFVKTFVRDSVAVWVKDIIQLSSFAESQPQAAFAVFSHGLAQKWAYLQQVTADVSELPAPLENAIRTVFCHG